MASESTISPTRRIALQDISTHAINKAPSGNPLLLGHKSISAEKSSGVAKQSSLKTSSQDRVLSPVRENTQLGGQKRGFELDENTGESGIKRFKGEHSVKTDRNPCKQISGLDKIKEHRVKSDGDVRSDCPGNSLSVYEDDVSTSLSPASSSDSSQGALNDSQNTLITEPDDSRVVLATRGEEIRQKARALRLRLSLANYKVQTDQIDIPISQLQVKSTSNSTQLPTLPPRTNTPRRRTLSTQGLSNIPDIRFPEPSSERAPEDTNITSSPPPCTRSTSPQKESIDISQEPLATPVLPHQREGLLNPPALGGDMEDRGSAGDLTSRVVKDQAADGLLSLMHHQS